MGHKIPFIFDFIPGSHPHAFRVISSHERRTHRELAPDAPARSGFSRPPKQRSASRSIHCVFFNLQTPASLQKTISFKFNRLHTQGEGGGPEARRMSPEWFRAMLSTQWCISATRGRNAPRKFKTKLFKLAPELSKPLQYRRIET